MLTSPGFVRTGISSNCQIGFSYDEKKGTVTFHLKSGDNQDFFNTTVFHGWDVETVDRLIKQLNQLPNH